MKRRPSDLLRLTAEAATYLTTNVAMTGFSPERVLLLALDQLKERFKVEGTLSTSFEWSN